MGMSIGALDNEDEDDDGDDSPTGGIAKARRNLHNVMHAMPAHHTVDDDVAEAEAAMRHDSDEPLTVRIRNVAVREANLHALRERSVYVQQHKMALLKGSR